ncbi:protoheme IX farnesyltransferase [Thermocrinis albus DSM 14484]|uniref:Protoheme IX farnesyltransferase n=1 Tax=Thermocrinis albus (strain DSM 14484 / JCM 11386 / HI 11/12) TaxID=638303 RepID=D3SMX8_THEAH|nr:heme o synthase [Thermocrinis albus]ADC90108.1 protoheme IX farnesyltransferase [Thermocrinis albus DSM 14484]
MVVKSFGKVAEYSHVVRDCLVLTKPGIVLLVLITTLTGMYIAKRGFPEPSLVLWTLVGTGLASAGSASLNQFLDRDIDARMSRTSHRPLPSGSLPPLVALIMGVLLLIASLTVMVLAVNLLAAFLTGLASLFYVVVYTLLFKRRSPWAVEIGGVSGAMPPVIGYAAVKGTLTPEAAILFAIMFFWQPPHSWVLAIKYLEDYRKAGIPVLPVVKGVEYTKIRTLLYTSALLPLSLLPYFYGMAGKVYLLGAFVLSALYIILTLRFVFSRRENGMFLFTYSIFYIALLFSLMVFNMER